MAAAAAASCPGIVPHPPQCSFLPMLLLLLLLLQARSQKPETKRFSGFLSSQSSPIFWAGPNWTVHQWPCLSGNAPEMCHLWSMKPKQIFDMGHFRETTQQFLRFKSSPLDVGVQKLQQWASANSIFLPSRQFWCLLLPSPGISHSELHVLTPLLLVPPSGRSLELHFGGGFVRHEPVPSLQVLTPFGYLNLITNSIFGKLLVRWLLFPIISCNRIAGAELQSVWVRQKSPKSQTLDPLFFLLFRQLLRVEFREALVLTDIVRTCVCGGRGDQANFGRAQF